MRVNIDPTFGGVGIDYLGLLHCKNINVNDLEDDEKHKCYDILYTCAIKRRTVWDAITDAHADTLLLSLTQYISHRVCQKQILPNNGPAFVSNKAGICSTKKYKMNFQLWRNPVVW